MSCAWRCLAAASCPGWHSVEAPRGRPLTLGLAGPRAVPRKSLLLTLHPAQGLSQQHRAEHTVGVTKDFQVWEVGEEPSRRNSGGRASWRWLAGCVDGVGGETRLSSRGANRGWRGPD